ncbi:MAG: paraquat-inducible protein A [Planctomycetota bacterium]|nr:paraquat-inducible protein A [Planctomycetota bacterium]
MPEPESVASIDTSGLAQRPLALVRLHKRRIDVPLALLVAIAALYFGLSLPVIKVKGIFVATEYSVWGGVKGLWEDSEHLLAIIVFLFSFVTPIAKLALIARLWFAPMAAASRRRVLEWMEGVGRWSMLDVFAVAILIVVNKIGKTSPVTAMAGVYWFCGAILLSMALTWSVRRVALRS